MKDFLEFVAQIAIGCIAFFGAVIVVVAAFDYADCTGFQAGTGIETKWRWGFYANVDGRWVPSKYAFGDAHELRIKQR